MSTRIANSQLDGLSELLMVDQRLLIEEVILPGGTLRPDNTEHICSSQACPATGVPDAQSGRVKIQTGTASTEQKANRKAHAPHFNRCGASPDCSAGPVSPHLVMQADLGEMVRDSTLGLASPMMSASRTLLPLS